MRLKYRTVKTIDEEWIGLGFLGFKMVLTVDIFMYFEGMKTHCFPIIQREFEAGSVIHSNEWTAYRCLNSSGYFHNTVNHQQNYMGTYTQSIERSWLDTNTKILKTMRGTPQLL